MTKSKRRLRAKFSSAEDIVIGDVVETKISGRWCPVVVLGRRDPAGVGAYEFDVRREPIANNSLSPRKWFELRPSVKS